MVVSYIDDVVCRGDFFDKETMVKVEDFI